MTLLATLGYAVQAVAALAFGHWSDRWTRSGRSEAAIRRWMLVVGQLLHGGCILGVRSAEQRPSASACCCASPASPPASLSLNLYAVAQMFAGPRAAGTWIGVQNALGNISGIFGPIVTGMLIDRVRLWQRLLSGRRGRRVRRHLVGCRRPAHRPSKFRTILTLTTKPAFSCLSHIESW